MTTLNIQLERNELQALKASAARQLRTPENLARFMILKQMGFILDDVPSASTKTNSDTTRQGQSVAAAQPF